MAENVAITPGTGDVVGADDITGVKYQRVKLIHGANGTNDGDVSTVNGLPIQGTVTANLSATDNAVLDAIETDTTTLAGAVSGTEMQVDVLTMPTVTVDLGVNNDVTVTGTVTANAGTSLNTSALALETGGNLASVKTNTDKIPALGQALAAASVPVILPSATITTLTPPAAITGFATSAKQDTQDTSINTLLKPASTLAAVTTVGTITNVVHVDDNAGALTVDGTVTANLSATDNAVLDDIAANQTDASQKTQVVDGAGNVIGATSNALDVNIKSGGAGDGAILDGVSSAIKATVLDYTSSNPIAVRLTDTGGDYVAAGAGTQYTEDAASAANPVGGALILVREDARAGTLTTTDGDNVAARGNNKGELYVKTTDSDALLTTIDADTSTIAGAVAGSEMQVDVLTMPTTAVTGTFWQATQPVSGTVTANAGTGTMTVDLGANNDVTCTNATAANLNCTEASAAAIKTAVEALDNSVDGNYLNVNMNIAGADVSGTVPVPTRAADFELAGITTHVKKYYTNAGAVTDGIIWSPAAGKRWYVTDIFINVSAAATVTLEDDLSGGDSAVWKAELAANSGWSHSFNTPLYSGEDAADLIITTSAGNVYVTCVGYEI